MNKILYHKNKVILIILGILILILSVFGLSYAYMSYIDKISGAYTPFGSDSTTDVGDYINFIPGDPLSLSPGSDNLNILTGNLESTTSPRVELSSEVGFNETNYYTYFIIDSNNFVYSSSNKKAEILLEVTDNEGNVITEITGLEYVTSGGVTGFDITDKEDEFYISKTYIRSDDGIVTSHEWNFTVTFVNLDSNQDVNYEKTFEAYIKMTHEVPKANFEYTGNDQTFTVTESGLYQIELWGAQGNTSSYRGGYGAYTSGNIYLNSGENLYFYIGQSGTSSGQYIASYNGGGTGLFDTGESTGDESSYSGGGATDVRLIDGAWNDSSSLNSRIIVSSGGNGSYKFGVGSSAGGLYGYYNYGSVITTSISQISGYNFGVGQNGINRKSGAGDITSEGTGGGYYTGRTGNYYAYWYQGSTSTSFISGHTGSVAITSESNRTPKNTGELLVDFPVRYIEVGGNRNSTNTTINDIVELEALDTNGVNIALGKVATSSATNASYPLSRITDGVKDTTYYSTNGTVTTVDLEQAYNLEKINLWRYYADGRTYLETYVKVYNEDKTKSAYIHHYSIDGTYAETASGYTMDLSNSYNQPCLTGTSYNSCSIHYSGKYFTNTVMIDGAGYNWTNIIGEQTPMPNPLGGYYPLGQGHTGNGYARITYIG